MCQKATIEVIGIPSEELGEVEIVAVPADCSVKIRDAEYNMVNS